MRAIETEINKRRKEDGRKSEIPLTNFCGIEIRDFPAEIARLALIIAEYQCDVLYRGQKEALQDFLPLEAENWITCGNALRLDWLSICPPTGTGVKHQADDLFNTPVDQAQIDLENEGGETYICSNPPYLGFTWQLAEQKAEIRTLLAGRTSSSGFLDYVAGWFIKAVDYGTKTNSVAPFVSSLYQSCGPLCSMRTATSVLRTRRSNGQTSPAIRRGWRIRKPSSGIVAEAPRVPVPHRLAVGERMACRS
jgi:hypothetical protein